MIAPIETDTVGDVFGAIRPGRSRMTAGANGPTSLIVSAREPVGLRYHPRATAVNELNAPVGEMLAQVRASRALYQIGPVPKKRKRRTINAEKDAIQTEERVSFDLRSSRIASFSRL
jgi:hypothetical protein